MARRAVKFLLSDALVTESISGRPCFACTREELWGFTLLLKSNKRFRGITGGGIGGFESNRSGLKCKCNIKRWKAISFRIYV